MNIMKDKKKIAVLIPCYNESKTIEKVVKDYKKALPNATIKISEINLPNDFFIFLKLFLYINITSLSPQLILAFH